MEGICDIDKRRLATRAVIVRQGERELELELCEYHYNQLRQQHEQLETDDERPGESLEDNFAAFLSQLGFLTQDDLGSHDAGIQQLVSVQTKASIRDAAETAVTFGRRELDTEHLLHALAGNNSVQKLLGRSPEQKAEDIRMYIEDNALKTDRPASPDEPIELVVSPHMKPILDVAIKTSRDLGQAHVEPEHLLIGIAQEPEGMGGEVLRSYGLTATRLRRKTIHKARG